MPRTVLVTGGSGFIGSHIARQLADRGDRVVLLDLRPPASEAAWLLAPVKERVSFVAASVDQWPEVMNAVSAHQPGAILMMLDPAAAYAGSIPERNDISVFVTHPTHPPVFNDDVGEARKDYFGAGLAGQSIVSALVQGPEAHYAIGEAISRSYFSPIIHSHRVTLEQLATLEPAMSETCGATFIVALKEAMDEAIARGVPAEAAKDFMLGHINVQLAIVFEQIDWKMSEGAYLVIREAMTRIFKPDWKGVFDPREIKQSVKNICGV